MSNYLMINAGIKIIITIAFSTYLIYKNIYPKALKLFIGLFIAGQLIGYGLNWELLKIVIPADNSIGTGTVTQLITSTIFPFLLAFTIRDLQTYKEGLAYTFYIRLMFLILILAGFNQLLGDSTLLLNTLLVLALGVGGYGLYQKYQS